MLNIKNVIYLTLYMNIFVIIDPHTLFFFFFVWHLSCFVFYARSFSVSLFSCCCVFWFQCFPVPQCSMLLTPPASCQPVLLVFIWFIYSLCVNTLWIQSLTMPVFASPRAVTIYLNLSLPVTKLRLQSKYACH